MAMRIPPRPVSRAPSNRCPDILGTVEDLERPGGIAISPFRSRSMCPALLFWIQLRFAPTDKRTPPQIASSIRWYAAQTFQKVCRWRDVPLDRKFHQFFRVFRKASHRCLTTAREASSAIVLVTHRWMRWPTASF